LTLRTILKLTLGLSLCTLALPLLAAPDSGRISGVVLDPSGTPQMGASVRIAPEQSVASSEAELLTNEHGHFSTLALPTGTYSIEVTLAGFLPTMEQHIQVGNQRTTVLEVILGSVFSSFEKLRQAPNERVAKDDWAWVLRGSPATRSVLQWQDGAVLVLGEDTQESSTRQEDRGQIVLSTGGNRPGSIGADADAPATSFSYDMGVGEKAKLLMAGQFSYGARASSEGFAGQWIPSGKPGVGSVTTFVVRQAQLGPTGPDFRGLRMSHDDQISLSDRVALRYGGELLVTGMMGKVSTAMRPRVELETLLGRGWRATTIVAARPWGSDDNGTPTGEAALHALDAFPTIVLRHGRPITEDDWHEELTVDHALGAHAHISAAFFHDGSNHTAVIGRGGAANAPDFLQDYFSQAFAYDGGGSSSSGVRAAYSEQLWNKLNASLVYAYAGALAPGGTTDAKTLRAQLSTHQRQALAGRASATLPHLGTQVAAGYQWLSGPVVSQLDSYGASLYHLDPYFSLHVRQPIPTLFSGHMEIEADAGNLFAQGYVPVETSRGAVILVSSYRYFRGGLSLQF
jgi:hypothetical protein